MGEFADMALDEMMDQDEIEVRYQTFEQAIDASVEESLYDYDGARFPGVFSSQPSRGPNRRSNRVPSVTKQSLKPQPKKVGGVESRLQSAWDTNNSMSLLLYGRSGTGKTTLWATFPKPILAIMCSGGSQPGELKSIDLPEYRKTIKPLVIQRSSDVRELVGMAGDFATVVLDHASGLQDLILKEILGLSEIPVQKSWGMATQQQYGQCALQCKEYFRAILDLSCHRVIVAQEREFNNDGDASELLAPFVGAALMPSLVGWLNPACDLICETFIRQKVVERTSAVAGKKVTTRSKVKGVEYCLRTAPDPVYTVKFRVPKGRSLPEVVVDPTYAKIKAIVDGTYKEGE